MLCDEYYMVKHKRPSGILIISTFPDEESIASIAIDLIVKKKLCACMNLAKVRSIYDWNSKLEDREEFVVFFKTIKLHANRLKNEIKKIHPYEVPEILEIKMDDVSKTYLSWLVEATTTKAVTRLHK
jgi:periplasmic divalent cation tolerance protein